MTTRERILMIRIMDKLEKHPSFGKTLGIEAICVVKKWKATGNATKP